MNYALLVTLLISVPAAIAYSGTKRADSTTVSLFPAAASSQEKGVHAGAKNSDDECAHFDLYFGMRRVSCAGCHDGQITVSSITGGFGPYWVMVGQVAQEFKGTRLTFSNLAGDTYPITITDNTDCQTVLTVDLQALVPLTVTFTTDQADTKKTGGTITITAITGGTAPYYVSVDGGISQPFIGKSLLFSDLAAGTHTISVNNSKGDFTSVQALTGHSTLYSHKEQ
ncbi:hypothetical protein H0W26_05125 [Candidatus Dependentiae bacterium]|nr:hypothetical protein [Candidatus Dependentiae bacterium]